MGERKPQHIWRRGRRVELVALTKAITSENGETRFVVGAYSPLWAELRGLGVTEHPSLGDYAVTHLASGACVKSGFVSISAARWFMSRIAFIVDWRKPAAEVLATPDLAATIESHYAVVPDHWKLARKE